MADKNSQDLLSPAREQKTNDEVCVAGDITILPDACLAFIFQFLGPGDRKRCSLVCRRWLEIDGESRHRLSLNAQSELVSVLPSLFSRFDAVTKLTLKCDRRSASIDDDALTLISLRCQNLTRLKLRSCRRLTDLGMANLAKNCKGLKKFSCGSCTFGAKGMNALLDNCTSLEELSVKRLRGISDGGALEPIGPGLASSSLKIICLKDLYNGQCFGPLLMASKNLRTLRLFRCSGNWDRLLEVVTDHVKGLIEVHLERLQVGDAGLVALSNCQNLEILHLLKTPECSNLGLISVAEKCKILRKLHIDGWRTDRIDDEGLIGISKYCSNLQELVLIGVNPTVASLEPLAVNCQKLEGLAFCGVETVGDEEISCIAAKCTSLKKLCIKSCPVSDLGMEALGRGCPNLIKVKVRKCRGVTCEGASLLRASRESLVVNLDTAEIGNQDANTGAGVQEGAVEVSSAASNTGVGNNVAPRSTSRSASFKSSLGFIYGRNLVSCTFRRWSSFNGSSSSR